MSNVWLHIASQSQPIGYLSSLDIGCEHNADFPASVSMILSDHQMTGLDSRTDEMLQSSSISLGPKCNSAADMHLYDHCFRVEGSSCTSAPMVTI